MNTDRRVILTRILVISLAIVCLAQLNGHSLGPTLMHFFDA